MSKYKYGLNNDGDKSDWVRVQFVGLTEEQMKHLHKAEKEKRAQKVEVRGTKEKDFKEEAELERLNKEK